MRNLCNNKHNITEKTLEKYLINHIKEELNNYIINMQITEIRNTKKDNTKAINKIKNKIEKLKDLYLDDLIDKETYKKDYENLNNQLEELSKENTNKIKIDWESKLIGIATDILSKIKLYDNYENEVTIVIEYNNIEECSGFLSISVLLAVIIDSNCESCYRDIVCAFS